MRCDAVRCGAVRCGAVRCGAVRCGAVRCGAVRCGAVRCGREWCGHRARGIGRSAQHHSISEGSNLGGAQEPLDGTKKKFDVCEVYVTPVYVLAERGAILRKGDRVDDASAPREPGGGCAQ